MDPDPEPDSDPDPHQLEKWDPDLHQNILDLPHRFKVAKYGKSWSRAIDRPKIMEKGILGV